MIRNREKEKDEDIWSAIQYLDPDFAEKPTGSFGIFTAFFLTLLLAASLIVLKLRGL